MKNANLAFCVLIFGVIFGTLFLKILGSKGVGEAPFVGEKEVGSTEVAGIELGVRSMSARGVRDREEVSAPVVKYSGVKGASVGTDRSCSVSAGHGGG